MPLRQRYGNITFDSRHYDSELVFYHTETQLRRYNNGVEKQLFSIVDNFIMDIKRCGGIFPLNEIRAVSKYFTALELIACDKHWAVLYQSFQLLLLRRVGDMLRVR